MPNMIKEKTWEEFKDSKLLWFVNRSLHIFGWAIVLDMDGDTVLRAYPARVKFRGFSESVEAEGFVGLTAHLKSTIDELDREAQE